jgi:excisionase family DNA binding protein
MNMSKKTLLTVPQAAQRLTISDKSTWRMVYAGKFEVVRIGRCVRVTLESVDDVIDGGTTPPTPEDDDD